MVKNHYITNSYICQYKNFLYVILYEKLGGILMPYKRIRDLREDNDLFQKDLAKILLCSQVSYSNYENGKHDIPTDILIKLGKFYNTSTDYILGLTSVKEPYP